MSGELSSVFVYGTLLFDEVTSELQIYSLDESSGTDVPVIRQTAVLTGFDRFTVRMRERGNFPAIVPGSGFVEGHLLTNVTAESLQRMDEFEGIADGYYTRELVTVTSQGSEHTAFVYVCGQPLREFLCGAWDADAFRDADLDWYVSNIRNE